MATIGDVARKAGVSTTLVSRYLNGVKGVSPASKEKIESAIRELNYVPDESARMLVRRRGGGAAETAKPAAQIADAIALVCEDTDAQLMSALYLGAKIALRASEETRALHLMLFCIPAGDDRAADEDDTLSFIGTVCKGVYAVGAGETLRTALQTLPLPVLSLRSSDSAHTLYRSSSEFRETLEAQERESGARAHRLYEKITAGDRTVTEEFVDILMQISDETPPDRSPLGRSLQSHLL